MAVTAGDNDLFVWAGELSVYVWTQFDANFFLNWLRIRYSRAKTKKQKLLNLHPVYDCSFSST